MDQGLQAFSQDDLEKAERLLRRALELDPAVKEAYHNLGALYARRDDMDRAREMYHSALELDPLYVYPRCSLALGLLEDDDLEGAIAMLQPLASVGHFHPHEMAFYSYVQARVSIEQKEYEQARRALEAALEFRPDYELARDLLGRLDLIVRLSSGFHSFFEQRRQREQSRRARLQAALTAADPSLAEVLSLYTKEALTGMARVILPWGGWSALRKAELRDRILAGFDDLEDVEWIVKQLTDTDRAALARVVAHGGHLPWSEFDAEYGNDLEESPYWQWHVPKTTMGRLRHRSLLVEATVDGQLLVVVPLELRPVLARILGIGDAVGA
jgi:tetratricopeptide (TPR) repeat protein